MRHNFLPLKIAFHELRHGWRHFGIFVACIVLGVAVMSAVGTLGSIVEHALDREAQSLLGGDVEITLTGAPATEEQLALMHSFGKLSHITTLRAMAEHSDMPVMVEIKAVDSSYPLLGKLELHEDMPVTEALSHNGVIVDTSLMSQMGVKRGETITLGNASYSLRATIKKEPDRVVHIFAFGPRVIMTHEALEKSGLAGPLSLTKHHYRIVMQEGRKVAALTTLLKERFPETGWSFTTGTEGNLTVGRFLEQLMSFLTLSGLATFLIGGVGIGSSVRAFLQKKSHTIAVMKVMGASRAVIFTSYMLLLALLTVLGGIAGVLIATVAVMVLIPVVGQWLPAILEQGRFDMTAALLSLWYGVLITYVFSIPALMAALDVRPAVLFRTHITLLRLGADKRVWCLTAAIALLLFTTLLLSARDAAFVAGASALTLVAFLLFWLCGRAVRFMAGKVEVRALWLKLALGNITRPGSTAVTVIFAIGISLTVLIALTLTEANFQARITRIIQEKAPSLFLIDIQPHQREGIEAMLKNHPGGENVMVFPMVRGRITALNGKAVDPKEVDENIRWAVKGDRGLSYSALPPANAHISSGKWWPEEYRGAPLVSVDERFLDGMKLALGDTITLNILGKDITATIASTRHIDYTTFQINFAMMLSPGAIERFPQSYVATIHLHKGEQDELALVREIARNFPGVTVIRTKEAVDMVQNVTRHIATALRATVGISLFAGLLVLMSALSATLEQRLYETAILKVLGGRKRDILKSATAEWMLLACATSVIAACIGTAAAWLIMQRFRGEGFDIMPQVTLATLLFSALVIWLTGYLGNRQLFNIRPGQLLRNE